MKADWKHAGKNWKTRKNPAKGAMENIKQDAGERTIPMTEMVHRAFVELRKQNFYTILALTS